MTVWMPDQKVALNNVLWPYPPNIYTPRGSLWRYPRAWRDATRVLRDLRPEMLIGQPTLTLKGKDAIFAHLNNYIDFSNLMLDQTLRGMLKGLGPEDLIDFVQLPEHLQKDPYLAGALQFGVGERRGIAKSQFLPRNLQDVAKNVANH